MKAPLETIAHAPGALPVLGHALPVLRDPYGFVSSLPPDADLVRVRLGPVDVVVVCDPLLTKQVLTDDRTYDKGGLMYDRFREVVATGLATCPYADHRRQRRLAQPAFHKSRLPGYADIMTRRIDEVSGSWYDGQLLQVVREMERISAGTGCETMFASGLTAETIDMIAADFTTVIAGSLGRMVLPKPLLRLPLPSNRRYYRARERLRRSVGGIITRYRQEGMNHGDLLSILLSPEDEGDPGLSDSELIDQVTTFFGASATTTGSALSWALHLVATHPQVQRALQAEADSVLDGDQARFEDLPRLELAGRVMAETLRLYPGGWMFTRLVTADTVLGGHELPAGTTVVFSPYLIHRRPNLYPEPESFDPDRWLEGPGRTLPAREAYIPFASGARKCTGDVFALTETTLALATIARRWHLDPVPGARVRPLRSAVLSPRGLVLRASARSTVPATQSAYQYAHTGS